MHSHTHVHSKRTVITIYRSMLVAVSLSAIPLQAQMGLGLTPMRLEFPATAGRAYSGALTLSNSAPKKVRVRTEILDFYVDDNQTPQFLPDVPAESEYSCRRWVSVNPMETEVEARGHLSVRYTVRIPAEAAERSYHCAIGFISMPTSEEMQGVAVRTAVRVVSTLYPIIGKPQVKGAISDMTLEPVAAGDKIQWRGIVVMENTALMLYRPKGRIEVVDAAGKVLETLEMVSFPVLPRRRQRFLLPLKTQLATGRYTLRARIDLGTEVQEASTEVSAEPRKQ